MAYSPEERKAAIDKLCHLIATGTKGIRSICADNPDLPHTDTFMAWLAEDDDFSERYARAREEQADGIAGEIVAIADAPLDATGFANANGEEVDVSAHAAAVRLDLERRKQQIEARKWVAGKLKPSVYGDRLQLDADVTVKMSDEQLESRLAFFLGKKGAAQATGGAGEAEGAA